MAARETLFGEGPSACPFVALELDRDRRADKPDYRHRCFAEPTPAPRAIAHQEQFCLSPQFPACPIFQDWAVRAAARPVPLPQGYEGRRPTATEEAAGGAAGLSAAAALADDPAPPISPAIAQPDPSWSPSPGWSDEPSPSDDQPATTDETPEEGQLAAFEPASVDVAADMLRYARPSKPAEPSAEQSAEAPAPLADEPLEPLADEPLAPAFLAGRSSRAGALDGRAEPAVKAGGALAAPPNSNAALFQDRVGREDVVPSWDLDRRYGAEPTPRERGDLFGRVTTALAVLAILAVGVAVVLLAPGFLAGPGAEPSRSPVASLPALPGASPTALASEPAIPASGAPVLPTAVPPTDAPTAEPTPEASPQFYRIRRNDNLSKIARRFGVTVADIMAANPNITNPNHIQVGQVIVIPPAAEEP